MSVAARETALLDVKSRGRSPHPYRGSEDVPRIMALNEMTPNARRGAAERVVVELTARDDQGQRELTTISARAGLVDVLCLVLDGRRQIGHREVAAICGVSLRTADTMLAQLVTAGVLWTKDVGCKGLSMTTWALGKRGVRMLVAAVETGGRWLKAVARAMLRLRGRRANYKHATFTDSISRRRNEATSPAIVAPAGDGSRAAPTLAEWLSADDPRCTDDESIPSKRCAYCRHGMLHP